MSKRDMPKGNPPAYIEVEVVYGQPKHRYKPTLCTLQCGWWSGAQRYSVSQAALTKHLKQEHPAEYERWDFWHRALFRESLRAEYEAKYGKWDVTNKAGVG